ncbi:hypothetical protein C8R45DRAFT_991355 [Mycena sanguinolenta]|nr:hypothetical protein C8R45DRAFT_991355 [Mycena sanguinolenta]
MRDPHETIIRDVLLFPAEGGEPRILPMTFSEAGAESNPYGLYTINVDLRDLFGKKNMHATRGQGLDVNNQPHKIMEGEYELYHNISPKLPINLSMARLIGVDPKRPGQRPLWRGDVVVVKRAEWPEYIPPGAGAHMDYLDFPPHAIELVNRFLLKWYNSDRWRDLLKGEREFNDSLLKMDQTWPEMLALYQLPENAGRSGFDQKKYDKTSRLIDRLVAMGWLLPVTCCCSY